jgi:hypothetical protein
VTRVDEDGLKIKRTPRDILLDKEDMHPTEQNSLAFVKRNQNSQHKSEEGPPQHFCTFQSSFQRVVGQNHGPLLISLEENSSLKVTAS